MSKIASFWPSEWLAVCGETMTLGKSHSGECGIERLALEDVEIGAGQMTALER